MEGLRQEIRVLRQAIEEFREDFTHLLRNLPDNLPPPYQHLGNLAGSFVLEPGADNRPNAISESLCCYDCNAESSIGLAPALHEGWIDIALGPEELTTSFVGWCPACQLAHEDESRRRNAISTQPAQKPPPPTQSRKTLFD